MFDFSIKKMVFYLRLAPLGSLSFTDKETSQDICFTLPQYHFRNASLNEFNNFFLNILGYSTSCDLKY